MAIGSRRSFIIAVTLLFRDRASAGLKQSQKEFENFGNFLGKKFVVTLGDVAQAVDSLQRAFAEGFQIISQEKALRAQLTQLGADVDEFLTKMDQAAAGAISTADLIASSSRALLLGLPFDKLAELLEFSRLSAISTGQDVGQAFDNITLGIARASPKILDNLGLTVDLRDANEALAESLGKTVDQLTEAERATGLLNIVLEQGEEKFGLLKAAVDEQVTTGQRFAAAWKNIIQAVQAAVTEIGLGIEASGRWTTTLNTLAEGIRLVGTLLGFLFSALSVVQKPMIALVGAVGDLIKFFRQLIIDIQIWLGTLGEAAIFSERINKALVEMGIQAANVAKQIRKAAGAEKERLQTIAFNQALQASYEELRKEYDANTKALEKLNAAREAENAILQSLGLQTTAQLTQALEDNALKVELLNTRYDQLQLSRAAYEAGIKQLRIEEEALRLVLDGTVATFAEAMAILKAGKETQDDYNESVRTGTDAQKDYADATKEAAEAVRILREEEEKTTGLGPSVDLFEGVNRASIFQKGSRYRLVEQPDGSRILQRIAPAGRPR